MWIRQMHNRCRLRAPALRYVLSDLLLLRALPASGFTIVLLGKVGALVTRPRASDGLSLPAAAYVLQQGFAVLFLGVVVALFVARRPTTGRRSSLRGGLVALVGTFILSVPVAAPVSEHQTAVLLVSSALVLIGTGFAITSLLALGRCFGVMPEARGLVTRGPYRWIRHPIYLGEIVSALGLVIGAFTWPMLGLFVVFFGLQYWRAMLEEDALEEAFPEYAEYRKHTYRLLPLVH